jgi:serine/threonine protein phosphatase PrpC
MTTPRLQGWIAASVAKPGSRTAENEDATAADPKRVRFAVADGATEGWQSGGWAAHLASAYIRRPPSPADFDDWLAVARREWTPPATRGAVWYTEVKTEQGSFATLLGLEFRQAQSPPGLAWKAVAVGDSCLLILRKGRFEVTFPISSVTEFGNTPPLVPSSPERKCPAPEWLAGRAEPGDLFLLVTDAVARSILASDTKPGEDPITRAVQSAVTSGKPQPVTKVLHELQGTLNDDATVVAVRVSDPPESPP